MSAEFTRCPLSRSYIHHCPIKVIPIKPVKRCGRPSGFCVPTRAPDVQTLQTNVDTMRATPCHINNTPSGDRRRGAGHRCFSTGRRSPRAFSRSSSGEHSAQTGVAGPSRLGQSVGEPSAAAAPARRERVLWPGARLRPPRAAATLSAPVNDLGRLVASPAGRLARQFGAISRRRRTPGRPDSLGQSAAVTVTRDTASQSVSRVYSRPGRVVLSTQRLSSNPEIAGRSSS